MILRLFKGNILFKEEERGIIVVVCVVQLCVNVVKSEMNPVALCPAVKKEAVVRDYAVYVYGCFALENLDANVVL